METTWWTQPEDLDEYQQKVVSLPVIGNFLVVGPPGSGKTNLLILRAAHLYGAGYKNIAVLTFGRVLREFLAAGSHNYVFPEKRVQTYNAWGGRLLESNDIEFDASGRFDEVRRRLLDGLKRLLAAGGTEEQYDCLLIDEVQDYTPEEIDVIRGFSKNIFAVGDNRQRIYKQDGAIYSLSKIVDEVRELPYHYRNGLKICRVADGIRNLIDDPKGLEATSNYDERSYPSSVLQLDGLDIDEQVAAAIPEIATQLRAYPDGMIGCLCARHEELDQVWAAISSSQLSGAAQRQVFGEYASFDLTKRVVVATMHGAKGLEFRGLHLFGMDKIVRHRKSHTRLAYTAVTRAKTSLTIYHNDSVPGYLERGIAAAKGAIIEPPKLSDLFRKG